MILLPILVGTTTFFLKIIYYLYIITYSYMFSITSYDFTRVLWLIHYRGDQLIYNEVVPFRPKTRQNQHQGSQALLECPARFITKVINSFISWLLIVVYNISLFYQKLVTKPPIIYYISQFVRQKYSSYCYQFVKSGISSNVKHSSLSLLAIHQYLLGCML